MKIYGIIFLIALIMQIFISNLLSIGDARPDFLIIFVLYFAINQGSFRGVILGFGSGLIVSIFDSGLIIGLLPLIYSFVGYTGGFLKSRHYKMVPFFFNFSCFLIIFAGFFIYSYFFYNNLFYNDLKIFLLVWLKSTIYTLSILAILQFIAPLRQT
ncbi:MAG: hypothetical protein V3R52_01655 [Candidatus Neomarinimicrobiota bacterium]